MSITISSTPSELQLLLEEGESLSAALCLLFQPHTITLDTLRCPRGLWAPGFRPPHPAQNALKMAGRTLSVWSAPVTLCCLWGESKSALILFTRLLSRLLAVVASPLARRGSTDPLRAGFALRAAFWLEKCIGGWHWNFHFFILQFSDLVTLAKPYELHTLKLTAPITDPPVLSY